MTRPERRTRSGSSSLITTWSKRGRSWCLMSRTLDVCTAVSSSRNARVSWPARGSGPIKRSVYANSVSGMNAADLIVSASADNIANADSDGYSPWVVKLTAQPLRGVAASAEKADAEGVDLADEMVGLITGSLLYKANARALKTSAETDSYIFDALA